MAGGAGDGASSQDAEDAMLQEAIKQSLELASTEGEGEGEQRSSAGRKQEEGAGTESSPSSAARRSDEQSFQREVQSLDLSPQERSTLMGLCHVYCIGEHAMSPKQVLRHLQRLGSLPARPRP